MRTDCEVFAVGNRQKDLVAYWLPGSRDWWVDSFVPFDNGPLWEMAATPWVEPPFGVPASPRCHLAPRPRFFFHPKAPPASPAILGLPDPVGPHCTGTGRHALKGQPEYADRRRWTGICARRNGEEV